MTTSIIQLGCVSTGTQIHEINGIFEYVGFLRVKPSFLLSKRHLHIAVLSDFSRCNIHDDFRVFYDIMYHSFACFTLLEILGLIMMIDHDQLS